MMNYENESNGMLIQYLERGIPDLIYLKKAGFPIDLCGLDNGIDLHKLDRKTLIKIYEYLEDVLSEYKDKL